MKIKTSRFGEMEVRDEDRLTVVGGLLGFYGWCEYVAYRPENLGIFRWLQSVDIPQLAFVICPAEVIVPGYHIGVPREELACIGVEEAEDAEVFVILTNPQDPRRMCANLLGPLIVNTARGLARQVVLYDTEYSSRHVVFPHLKGAEGISEVQETKPRQECA